MPIRLVQLFSSTLTMCFGQLSILNTFINKKNNHLCERKGNIVTYLVFNCTMGEK